MPASLPDVLLLAVPASFFHRLELLAALQAEFDLVPKGTARPEPPPPAATPPVDNALAHSLVALDAQHGLLPPAAQPVRKRSPILVERDAFILRRREEGMSPKEVASEVRKLFPDRPANADLVRKIVSRAKLAQRATP